jgi:hypothetical protein
VRNWAGERPDPASFASEILPVLRQHSIGELVTATGLSAHYCSLIRLGKKTPHPRHWYAFRMIGSASAIRLSSQSPGSPVEERTNCGRSR